MPGAGVGEQDLGHLVDASGRELAFGGLEHRLQVPEGVCPMKCVWSG
jgi:hypothetical protein